MTHKHTCIDCGTTITEGDFDCELDQDHDYERCDQCARIETEANQAMKAWQEEKEHDG